MAVSVGAGHTFEAGPPQALFHANVWNRTFNRVYAATRDGQRFLVNAMPQHAGGSVPIAVILDWPAAFRR